MKKILLACLLLAISLQAEAQTQINSLPSGTWSGNEAPKVFNQKLQLSYATGGGFPNYGTILAGGGSATSQDAAAFQLYFPAGPNFGGLAPRVRMGKWDNAGWTSWSTFYTSANANSLTADWSAKQLLVNDKLGIGTNQPSAKLHVNNGTDSYGAILATNTGGIPYHLYTKTLGNLPGGEMFRIGLKLFELEDNGFISFYRGGLSNGGFLGFSTNGSERIRIATDGNVGIGTESPSAKLHVNNGNDSYGAILATNTGLPYHLYTKTLQNAQETEMFRLGMKLQNSENNGFISFYRGGLSRNGFLGFSTDGVERIRIDGIGNVGIGTDSPDEKLVVDGTVRSEEVRVEVVGAPDYVFAPAYELITLEEVEDYIDEHSHLPEIPSAVEMETEGVELGVMNMRLLKKIEELTLYTIDQEKRLLKQQEKIKVLESQQAQINLLAKELQALKQAIKKD